MWAWAIIHMGASSRFSSTDTLQEQLPAACHRSYGRFPPPPLKLHVELCPSSQGPAPHSANEANEQAPKPSAAEGMADEQEEDVAASLPWHPQHGQTHDFRMGLVHLMLSRDPLSLCSW